jgi:hypothetical protein
MTNESGNLVTMEDYEYIPPLPGDDIWVTKDFLQTIPVDNPNPDFEKGGF